jgi:hypothetical protein
MPDESCGTSEPAESGIDSSDAVDRTVRIRGKEYHDFTKEPRSWGDWLQWVYYRFTSSAVLLVLLFGSTVQGLCAARYISIHRLLTRQLLRSESAVTGLHAIGLVLTVGQQIALPALVLLAAVQLLCDCTTRMCCKLDRCMSFIGLYSSANLAIWFCYSCCINALGSLEVPTHFRGK